MTFVIMYKKLRFGNLQQTLPKTFWNSDVVVQLFTLGGTLQSVAMNHSTRYHLAKIFLEKMFYQLRYIWCQRPVELYNLELLETSIL